MISEQTKVAGANAVNAMAIAHHSDPMMSHARLLGSELRREELEHRYEVVCLLLAFSVCVNVGAIIYFAIRSFQ
jgi:hypothetical protein